MSELRLANPLGLLMVVPLLATLLISLHSEKRNAVLYSSARLLDALPITLAQRAKSLLPWLRFAGLLLVVIALARPQHGLRDFRVRTEGIGIAMCVDRSRSMLAMDFQINNQRVDRLQVVKQTFRDFVIGDDELPGRPDDQIGLIAFGGYAEAKSPLTLDHGALLEILDTVQIAEPIYDTEGNLIYRKFLEEEWATAIGDAVTLAVDRLKDAKAKSKVVILLSDGENNAGVTSPEEAAEAAESFGIKIYAIGVGTTGRAPFRITDNYGRERLVSQAVKLDEEALKMLAERTGGRYFNAKHTDALEGVYREIDQLEKIVTEGRLYTEYHELFQWWLLPGLAMIVFELGLRCTRFRSLP
jgi:Ca-activated chloride channel family protein